jgi:hypothetical protein
MLAYQVLANEVEHWRRVGFPTIDNPDEQHFQQPNVGNILAPLAPYVTLVTVTKTNDDVRQLTFSIKWDTGKREAKLSIARANLGDPSPAPPGSTPLW